MNRDREEDLDPISEWMQADRPPFGEEDYTALRRGVWQEIEAGRRREAAFRPGRLSSPSSVLAFGAALAAVLAAVVWLRPRPETPAVAAFASAPGQAAQVTLTPPSPVVVSADSAARPSSPRRARRPAAGVVPVKIEFQTANPNVRIIWLARMGDAAPVASRTEEVS